MSARDFVYVSKKGYDGQTFAMGGKSVEYKDAPAQGKIVRAHNGPGCQMVKPGSNSATCDFIWLMDCDYKVRLILLSPPPNLLCLGLDASEYSGCRSAFRAGSAH